VLQPLKLQYDELLSNLAFKSNLRRYTKRAQRIEILSVPWRLQGQENEKMEGGMQGRAVQLDPTLTPG